MCIHWRHYRHDFGKEVGTQSFASVSLEENKIRGGESKHKAQFCESLSGEQRAGAQRLDEMWDQEKEK